MGKEGGSFPKQVIFELRLEGAGWGKQRRKSIAPKENSMIKCPLMAGIRASKGAERRPEHESEGKPGRR